MAAMLRRMLAVLLWLSCAGEAWASRASVDHAPAEAAPDLVLQGELSGRDHQSYRTVPFDVPAGTVRITVEFDYSGRDRKTTIDLGVLGPDGFRGQDGFRGWSGGNKRWFTLSASDATPSYLPGPIRSGQWALLLGVPNIRADEHAEYRVRIWLTREDASDAEAGPELLAPVLRAQPGWYRGDLHMHTGHSDASCASQNGTRVPCPLFLTARAASQRGLDFVAITDHNTVSHLHDIRGLQPYFDRLLLMSGMEITTFQGHVNVFGLQRDLDFRLGSDAVPDWNTLLAELQRRGLPASVNHPIRPSDERCMGCGWTPRTPVDMSRIAAVEVVNGDDAGTPASGIPFWYRQLDAGHRLTAIGGSDNHDAALQERRPGTSGIGTPTTVVHADALSQAAVLEGIRRGRVYVDVEGSAHRRLVLTAQYAGGVAQMGDALTVRAGDRIRFDLDVADAAGAQVEWLLDGAPLAQREVMRAAGDRLQREWRSDGRRHWLSANVYGADGRLHLIGNPIYINFGQADPAPRR
ncbi:CehA/McbA family metallohydrolase [Pseudoxanthomonas wuyuanensis]